MGREAIAVETKVWYEFLVSASCPPDKRVHVRGGIATPAPHWGWIMYQDYIPAWVCDFEDGDAFSTLTLNFTNADYYLPIILCYFGDWIAYRTSNPPASSEPVFDCEIGTEVATAAEAESQIDSLLNGSNSWCLYRFPLYGIVFKNDGATGADAAILPVDSINRGRSYIYRDVRMRNCLLE